MNDEHNLALESCFDFNQHAKHPEAEDLIWGFISTPYLFSEKNTSVSEFVLHLSTEKQRGARSGNKCFV